MKTLLILFPFIILSASLISCNKNETPEKGVSKNLAIKRKASIDSLNYRLHFSIPASSTEQIKARQTISFYYMQSPSEVILDFKESGGNILSLTIGDHHIDYEFVNEHIIIPSEYIKKGRNQISMEFIAGELSLNRQNEFMYTLFVPDRARTAFPCFDQPDMKANFELSLEIPADWTAVANGIQLSSMIDGDRKFLEFARTKKLPTYLFAFTTGKFSKITRTYNQQTVSMYHRESDTVLLNNNVDEIFYQVFSSLDWMEKYTGIPYPFAKYDLIAIPSFQYGGMEHTGATLYRAERIILPPSPTQEQLLGRANLIAHETAHMWFGDLVTMKWFDEVWLKEVFANFIAEKITNPWFTDTNHELKFLLAHYPDSYEIDRTTGANPIQQKLENLEDAGTVYGAIIYHKAPLVMKKLEEITGEEKMKEGLQEYLEKFGYDNATWNDLINILDEKTQKDLFSWSKIWVEEPGMPHYFYDIQGTTMQIHQTDAAEKDRIWPDKFMIKYRDNNYELEFSQSQELISIEYDSNHYFNPTGMGYGFFQIRDTKTYLQRFEKDYRNLDALNRGSQWLIIYENLLHDRIDPSEFLEYQNKLIGIEKDPLILEEMLKIQRIIFWKFLSIEDRENMESLLVDNLWRILSVLDEKGKKSIFNQIVDLSYSDKNLEKIMAIWTNGQVNSVSLSENELTEVCYELLLKKPSEFEKTKIFHEKRMTNEDRISEFHFVCQGIEPDRTARQQFFLSLEDPANRERESWVQKAVHYLNHPLRQEDEVKNLYHYLELLPEIKETGDIFFPKRWLDAVLGGHNSIEAKMIVKSFLEENPELPPSLVFKLKQSADMLYRANTILYRE